MKLTYDEIAYLLKDVDALESLIKYHDQNSAMTEAWGADQSSVLHYKRMQKFQEHLENVKEEQKN